MPPDSAVAGRADVWRRFRRNRLAVVGLIVIGLLVLVAVLAPVITRYSPNALGARSEPGRAGPSWDHWFGTDLVGRDLFARVVYGARVSLRIGFVAVAIATTVGVVVGAVAGYWGGAVDNALMRTTDVFLSFPLVVAGLVLATVVGKGERTVILVLAFVAWMPIARLLRSSVLQAKEREYVEAARAAGCSDWRIVTRHILPNTIQPVIVLATILVGTAVLTEAALSFLGVGVQPPTAAWGLMVNEGRSYLRTSPHLLFFPAAAIVVTVMAFVFVGDGLRDALDPRLR
ncbi:MAG: ABC transporter permease [Acidimicrobiales bacterium]